MNVLEAAIQILNADGKAGCYVSKESKNLDYIGERVFESVDLDKTKSRFILVHPIGINQVPVELDHVFADIGCTSEAFIKKFMKLKDNATIDWVQPSTMKIEQSPEVIDSNEQT